MFVFHWECSGKWGREPWDTVQKLGKNSGPANPLQSLRKTVTLHLCVSVSLSVRWGHWMRRPQSPLSAIRHRIDVLSSQESRHIHTVYQRKELQDLDSTLPPFQASKHVLWLRKCVCPWLQADTHVPRDKNSKTQGRDRNQREKDGSGIVGRVKPRGIETQYWGSNAECDHSLSVARARSPYLGSPASVLSYQGPLKCALT